MTNTDVYVKTRQQEFNYPQARTLLLTKATGALSWAALAPHPYRIRPGRPGQTALQRRCERAERLLMRRTVRERVAPWRRSLPSTRTRTSCWATTAGSHGSGCVHAIGYLSVFHALLCRWPIHQLHAQQRQSGRGRLRRTTTLYVFDNQDQFWRPIAHLPGFSRTRRRCRRAAQARALPNCCLSYRLKSTASIT